jgi:glycosyltransferase involved in cell wall biosynthesis
MTILLFNWRDPKNPKAGGAEIATLNHALGWIDAGHTVLWFSTSFPDAVPYENYKGIHIYRQGNQISVYLRAFLFYQKMHKKIDIVIDEIHGLPFFTPLYVRKPRIAFINEVANVIWDYMFPFPLSKIGKYTEPLLLQLYKRTPMMTGSQSAKDDLVALGFSPKNITVIHHGLDVHEVADAIKKETKPTCLFVNRLVKMKGIEDVLRSFAIIHKQVPDAQLWIVGKGESHYVEKLKEMAKTLQIQNNAVFFGYVPDKEKYTLLKRAHVLLHASVKEGWGLNVIEAASQGTPTVAYRVGGLIDSIKDGETGLLTKENTPENLASYAVQLLNNKDLYFTLQKHAIAWSKKFSWKDSIKQSIDLLTTVSHKKTQ